MRLNHPRYLEKAKANRDRLDRGDLFPLIYSHHAKAFIRATTKVQHEFSLERCLALTTKKYKMQELFKFFRQNYVTFPDLVNCRRWSELTLREWFIGSTPHLQPSNNDIEEIVRIFSERE